MKIRDIAAETRPLVVPFASGDLKIEYRPNAFTVDAAEEVNAAMQDPAKQTSGIFDMITSMLVSWDLEDDKGVIPLDDHERIRREVPMAIFGRIFKAMQADQETEGAGKGS